MIIDSHCHLDYPNLYDQLLNVLNRAKRNNVDNLLTICTTLESFEKIKVIVNKYSNIYGGNSISDCQVCTNGKYSYSGSNVCESCIPGMYTSNSGSITCTDCEIGKYSSKNSSIICDICPIV